MAETSRLYDELLTLVGQPTCWADVRHLQTLVWMVIGLICSGCISLTRWGVYIQSRACYAQSRQRRWSRWLHNPRINVQRLYSPLIATALSQWEALEIVLILDTTMLWEQYCVIRVCVKYRGRAVPEKGRVLAHESASVCFQEYQR